MGASASVIDHDDMPDEIRFLIKFCEHQKKAISEDDGITLNKELVKVFKKHSVIIGILTSRTKNQARKLYNSTATNADDISGLIGDVPYAKFCRFLFMSKEQIETEMMVNSNKQMFDEDQLINIVGTSTKKEVTSFMRHYEKASGSSIMDKLDIQSKKPTMLQRLLVRMIDCDRDEGDIVDEGNALLAAKAIHKEASRFMGYDENVYFDQLIGVSRAQCVAISDAYDKLYKIRLERAINTKFNGSAAKLLCLWSQPIAAAVASVLYSQVNRLLVDQLAVGALLAKYDKDFITDIDDYSRKAYQKKLFILVNKGLSGQLYRAVKSWIESPTPDGGFERHIESYFEKKVLNGIEMDSLIRDENEVQIIQKMFENQSAELNSYILSKGIKFDPQAMAKASPKSRHIRNPKSTEYHPVEPDTPSMKTNEKKHAKKKHTVLLSNSKDHDDEEEDEHKQHDDHKAKTDRLEELAQQHNENVSEAYDVLRDHFDKFAAQYTDEVEPSCELKGDQFWSILKKLPLTIAGFSEEEIDSMRDWVDWEHEGVVLYDEVLFELADSVVQAIESKTEGSNDVHECLGLMQDELDRNDKDTAQLTKSAKRTADFLVVKSPNNSSRRKRRPSMTQVIPSFLLQYLFDTMEALDLNNNGKLDEGELQVVLTSIGNMGMDNPPTPGLFLKDAEEPGHPTFREVARGFAKIIVDLMTTGEDRYLCLIDKESGAWFWYNIRDGTTQWAASDQTSMQSDEIKDGVDLVGDELLKKATVANESKIDVNDDVLYANKSQSLTSSVPSSARPVSAGMSSPNSDRRQSKLLTSATEPIIHVPTNIDI
eukprot:gene8342-11285_t